MAEGLLWLDTYECGHTQRVECMVPIDRESRVGEPTVCFTCKEAGEFHIRQRVAVQLLDPDLALLDEDPDADLDLPPPGGP
jgi:hypothetical protein